MLDKNGTEIKTGAIVEISGAYFKNDNGLYFVQASPGDPSWCGRDYSLRRISKAGKISTAKYSLCFWPISVFISNRAKAAEARQWNREGRKMCDKKKASTSSAKRVEAKETAGFQGSAISTNDSTTKAVSPQVTISGFLHIGRENALPLRELRQL